MAVLNDYTKWLKDEKTPLGKIKVIDASLDLFAKQGFDGTSTKEIAQKSGMSEATIFKYFGTKDNLLMEILDPIIQHILPNYRDEFIGSLKERNDSLRENIRFIVQDRFDFLEQNQRAFLILGSQLLTNQRVQKQLVKLVEARKNDILIMLKKVFLDSSEVRTNIDTLTIPRLVISQIVGYFLQSYKFFPNATIQEKKRGLQQVEDTIFYAIKK